MVLKLLLKIMFDSDKKINNNSHYRIMGVTIMEFMLSQLGKPILRRLGTAMGASLLTLGYAQESAVNFETAFTSLGLILIDLVLSYKDRKK
jgi:hypothetical protein